MPSEAAPFKVSVLVKSYKGHIPSDVDGQRMEEKMIKLFLAAMVVLCSITESRAETTCKLIYKDIFDEDQTKEFQCQSCCCDEPYKTHCCRCWWLNLLGPGVGLVIFIFVTIAFFWSYKNYRKNRRTGALREGQVLHVPPGQTGVENSVYSQPGAPCGGQSASIQTAWVFPSSSQSSPSGQQAPTVTYPGQQAPPVSYPGQQAPPVSYPGQQAPPVSYPGQQAPPFSFPGQQAPSINCSGQQAPQVSVPGQQSPPMTDKQPVGTGIYQTDT